MLDREQFLNDYIGLGAERKNKIHWHILISVYNTLISPITVVPYIQYSGTVFSSRWSDSVVVFLVVCYAILVVPTVSNRLSFKDQHHFSFGSFSWRWANSPLIYSVGWFLQALAYNLLGLTPSRHWSTDGLIIWTNCFCKMITIHPCYQSLFLEGE